jgi:hypothetical protein
MSEHGDVHIPSREDVERLTPELRANMAAAYMQGLEPAGKHHYELFVQMARLTTLSTVELVPLRYNPETGVKEVLLTQRPDSDRWWAGMWHVPGTVIFPTHEIPHDDEINFEDPDFDPIASYSSPIEQIISGELQNGIEITDGPYLAEARHRKGNRGTESTVMLMAGVRATGKELPIGRFFNTAEISNNPPEQGLIIGHAGLIERAAAK